jgi:hypothetical protein
LLLRVQGQQQQDSHELLRCLMEGLRAEERRALAQLRKGQVPGPVLAHHLRGRFAAL